jgi:hypothetical protein
MPRNGNGLFTLVPGVNPVVPDTLIDANWANPTMNDVAQGLSNSLASDGQTAPTGNLPMSGFKHTGVGVAAALTEYARASQVQNGSIIRCIDGDSTDDHYEASLPFGATAFANGQMIVLQFPTTNMTTTPTLSINGGPQWPILREDGSAIVAGDCRDTVPSRLMWNDTSWLLLGAVVSSSSVAGVSSFNARTGAVVLTSADIVAAQPYVPVNKAGDTMAGLLALSGNASLNLHATPLQQVQALITAAIGTVGGVVTWNGRAGAVTMIGSDVVTALTYTPANKAGETFGGAVSAPSLAATGAVTGATVTATGAVTGKQHTQTPNIATGFTGAQALDYANGQSQQFTISGAVTVSAINNVPVGNILRLAFLSTNLGAVTWPAAVKWPFGTTVPDLAAGTLKQAVVVLEAVTGGNLLANAAVY